MTTSRRSAPMSRLEQLPAELLEQILLEAVSGVRSPAEEPKNSSEIRCYVEMYRSHSYASELLALRYTCRIIRDCSWPALGKVVGETVFDMCSRKSMKNLVAVSTCDDLAPWIRKLTFTSCYVEGPWPKAAYDATGKDAELHEALGFSLLNNVKSIIEDDLTWFPKLWLSITKFRSDGAQTFQDSVTSSQLWQLVVLCLKALPNVVNVHYYHQHIAGRFMESAREASAIAKYYIDWFSDTHPGVQIGQNLLLGTLAESPILLKKLELATEMNGPHCFKVQATTEVIAKISKKVEVLTLRDEFGDYKFRHNKDQALSNVLITKHTFPALHTLVLDGCACGRRISPPLPLAADVPSVTSLTIRDTDPDDTSLVAFIALFKDTLRHTSFINMRSENFEPVIEVFQNFNLERLSFYEKWRSTYEEGSLIVRNVSKKLLYGAVRTVVIEPAACMDDLARKWAENDDEDGSENAE